MAAAHLPSNTSGISCLCASFWLRLRASIWQRGVEGDHQCWNCAAHADRQCTSQQHSLGAMHAMNQSSNITVNAVLSDESLVVLEPERSGGGGTGGVYEGGQKIGSSHATLCNVAAYGWVVLLCSQAVVV